MTYRPVSIVAPIAASICLLLAGTSGASAQIQCWMGPSAGPPIVNDPHIFCGEIRQRTRSESLPNTCLMMRHALEVRPAAYCTQAEPSSGHSFWPF